MSSRFATVVWSVVVTSLLVCSVCQADPPSAKSATVAVPSVDYYVAVNVSDMWSGKLAAPNTAKTDGPFATLERARDAARELGTNQARRIVVRGGSYYEVSLLLDARDSGLEIVAAPGENPMLYGGRLVTGWEKDGDKFYAARLPGVSDRTWDFRSLVVNDQLRPRALLPQTGKFTHLNRFNAQWHSTVGGGFRGADKPELKTCMKFRKGDLGTWLDLQNAELTIDHQWDDSIVGLKSMDPDTQTLTFSNTSGYPPGAFGVRTYVVWNIREGLHEPGQWYLDRSRGMVVYWPRPGEDMGKLNIIAPTGEWVICIRGSKNEPVTGVKLQGLVITATTARCVSGGFGAIAFPGAVEAKFIRELRLSDLHIGNVGGQGIRMGESTNSVVEDCEVANTGACGIRFDKGVGNHIVSNRVAGVGRIYASAIGLSLAGADCSINEVSNNEVSDAPYVGICFGGRKNRYERNLVRDVMKELRDGAAFYGDGQENVLRGNVVRDIPPDKVAHAYYIDELGENCLVENNLAVNCEWPVHMHMATKNTIRNNLFVTSGSCKLTFPKSSAFVMDKNIVVAGDSIVIGNPSGVTTWTNNLFFSSAGQYQDVPDSVQICDPIFVDAANGDYRFPTNSPAAALGILPQDFRDVGRRGKDALLATAFPGAGYAVRGSLDAAPSPKLTSVKVVWPPTLDGNLDDEAWAVASAGGGKAVIDLREGGDTLADTPRVAYLAYDKDALYLAFVIPTPKTLTANEKEGGDIWKDGEHEFFWQLKKGGPYGHLCVNVAGAKFTEVRDGDAPDWKLDNIRAAAGKTATAHVVEVAIPFAAVGGAPSPGTAWRVNLAGHEVEGDAFLSTAAASVSFLNPETFLELIFK